MADKKVSRRGFLKGSAAGAAGLAVAGAGVTKAGAATTAWTNGMQINPAIDNLRVVCCRDSAMVSQNVPILFFSTMSVQNGAAVTSVIQANMDEMAKSLAQASTASAGWAAIFQKPASKTWAQVRAAIKVNCFFNNHPRVAVVGKVCSALRTLGVPAANIVIYDAHANASSFYASYVGNGLPTGVIVSNGAGALGGTTQVTIPSTAGGGTRWCVADLHNGLVDILINVAVCKGHGASYASTTMTMKNHFGTYDPNGGHVGGVNEWNFLVWINKSNAVIGNTTPPCQQLCIVDALWSRAGGPGDDPNANTHRIVMGTFGPAVDFLTCKKVREVAPVNATHSSTYLPRMLTDFGYSTTERDNVVALTPAQNSGKGWVEVTPASQVGVSQARSTALRSDGVTISVPGGRAQTFVALKDGAGPVRVEVMELDGRLVRAIESGNQAEIVWDGRDGVGNAVRAGRYVLKVIANGDVQTAALTLVH